MPNVAHLFVAGVLIMSTDAQAPLPFMLFAQEKLLPGREATYTAIERDAARICAELHCPNVHLAIESLSGPKEVWWLTAYHSEADKQRIIAAYATNAALTAALASITKRKEGVAEPPREVHAKYRADLSGGGWDIARARFLVITVARDAAPPAGSVFEAPDGTRYVVRLTRTQSDAEELARKAGPGTTVFAVRPYWGLPDKEWIAADPEFWSVNPSARRG